MGFVVIVEPDEVNAQRIRTILDSVVDREFDYELTGSAERGIELFEQREVDVFIGDMEMPIISAAELFSMVEMMSPDTVRMVVTDANRVKETIAFMNQCRTFKLIIKPCRIADDIVTPIEAALEYKNAGGRTGEENRDLRAEYETQKKKCIKAQRIWKANEGADRRIGNVYAKLLSGNLKKSNYPPKVRKMLEDWYAWITEEYVEDMLLGLGNYRESDRRLNELFHQPEQGCSFRLRRSSAEPIEPAVMKQMTYLVAVLSKACREILIHYDITALILTMKESRIIRFRCTLEEDPSLADAETLFQMSDKQQRQVLMEAAKYCVDAMGHQYAVQKKECDYNINIVLKNENGSH